MQLGEVAVVDYVRALSSLQLTQKQPCFCHPLSRTRQLSGAQVLRRSNGYFIYSTVEGVSYQPRSVPTGPYSFCMVRIAGVRLCSSCRASVKYQIAAKLRHCLKPSSVAAEVNG